MVERDFKGAASLFLEGVSASDEFLMWQFKAEHKSPIIRSQLLLVLNYAALKHLFITLSLQIFCTWIAQLLKSASLMDLKCSRQLLRP